LGLIIEGNEIFKDTVSRHRKIMSLYDTIQAINKGETTSTYKKVAELATEKQANKN
jgi:hypothetical protein